jgi:monofunctional biosynthetic peptidoglycan transglycosylase
MRKSTARSRSRVKAFLIIGLCLPIGAVLFFWLLKIPDVSALRATNPTGTALMEARQTQAEAKGRTIERQWTWVPLSRISPSLRQAVVEGEDASFFTHEGFDWEGIKDAALYNLEAGKLKRGGSTITQQLAKNLYLSSERSLIRKAREALITRSLEQHLTKERILELYLNVAEWGQGVYGAEAAARHHFKKPSRNLTADEAAWLAAILPSPRRYDPIRKTAFLAHLHDRILKRITQGSHQPEPELEPEQKTETEP